MLQAQRYLRGLASLNDPKFVRLKGTNALLFAVVVACGRRNVSSQIMKISASMLPSARSHELTYVGFMTGPVRSGCDRQHLFRLWRQTRPDCGTTCRRSDFSGWRLPLMACCEHAPPASPKSANWRAVRGRVHRPGARGRRRAQQAGRGAAPRRHRIRQLHERGFVLGRPLLT